MSIAGCEEKAALERRGFRPNFLVRNSIVTICAVSDFDRLNFCQRISTCNQSELAQLDGRMN